MERGRKRIRCGLAATLQRPAVRPMTVLGGYDSSDPFAVKLIFSGEQIWNVAYDVLIEALALGEAGEGDIRVRVRDEAAPEERVLITLDNLNGHAEIAFDIDDLTTFVRKIEQAMATADLTIDWDRFLADVLDGAA